MAASKDDIPPVPIPHSATIVPPIEPAPAAPTAPEAPTAPTGYGQPGYAPSYAPQAAGPAQGLSIASMILGIAGLVLALVGFGFLVSVAAVITGHLGQKRQLWAKPFWLTGIITGYVGVAIGLITGLFLLFLFIGVIGGAAYLGR